eukprot:TRINITY_DN17247_c0_g1_i1.p1 TRINITY_DN17247_c0_g1~~TRINITY_DN17247_c0_g1_i1.p1  ORF type:complete len:294 (-),score=59.56 TRINITY_DN17247_c0_g1_i1:401-1282(-)
MRVCAPSSFSGLTGATASCARQPAAHGHGLRKLYGKPPSISFLHPTMAEKPTVLFVHGAWHSPMHLAPAAFVFESAGYPTCCPLLPSYGAQPPTKTLYDDAAALRAELDRLIEKEGKDVLVVMHSYGGLVGTEAVHESLGKRARAAEGKAGGVLRLVFLCAFVVPEGASLLSALGGEMSPFVTINEDGSCVMQEPAQRFYHDVPAVEQQQWVSKLRPHPVVSMNNPVTYLAYEHHPASYIFCENDRAVPVEVQRAMVDGAGVEMRTETLPSGHSPFLSMPEMLLEAVQKTVGI